MKWVHEGIEIEIEADGRFAAKIGEQTIFAQTLVEARDKVHDANLRANKVKLAAAVPVFVTYRKPVSRFGGSDKRYAGLALFRGIHAARGVALLTVGAEKIVADDLREVTLYPERTPLAEELIKATRRIVAAETEYANATRSFDDLRRRGVEVGGRSPRDAADAGKITEEILAKITTPAAAAAVTEGA